MQGAQENLPLKVAASPGSKPESKPSSTNAARPRIGQNETKLPCPGGAGAGLFEYTCRFL